VFLIVAGSYFVVDRQVGEPRRNAFVSFFRERGVQLRFAALVLAATEAVFLKRAILQSSPWTVFVLWSVLGVPLAAVASLVFNETSVRQQAETVRRWWPTFLALAITTGLMQLMTVLTFRQLQVGYSLALFQLSAIVSVLLGHRYFQEQNIRKRLAGSVVMTAGAIMIVAFGS
jgi:drug/metabolite transporter (DMT)-like permease